MLWLYFAICLLICWIVYECISGCWNFGVYNKSMMITAYVFLALSVVFAIGVIVSLALELMGHRKHINMIHCKIAPEDCREKISSCEQQNMTHKKMQRKSIQQRPFPGSPTKASSRSSQMMKQNFASTPQPPSFEPKETFPSLGNYDFDDSEKSDSF